MLLLAEATIIMKPSVLKIAMLLCMAVCFAADNMNDRHKIKSDQMHGDLKSKNDFNKLVKEDAFVDTEWDFEVDYEEDEFDEMEPENENPRRYDLHSQYKWEEEVVIAGKEVKKKIKPRFK
jgi:hypothetical protein